MNPKRRTDLTSDQKATTLKKPISVKFDKEGVLLAWGLGIASAGIGIFIIWATQTAPKFASRSTGFSVTQRLTRLMPETAIASIAFILGVLFFLFGVFCLFLGLKLIVQYLASKLRH